METLQLIPLEEIPKYLYNGDYWIIPVERDELDVVREGRLVPKTYVSAFKDPELIKIRGKLLKEEGKVFLLLVQGNVLSYFTKVEVARNPKGIYEKLDDGFDEYRIEKAIKIEVIGYSVIRRMSLDRNEWGDIAIGRERFDGKSDVLWQKRIRD